MLDLCGLFVQGFLVFFVELVDQSPLMLDYLLRLLRNYMELFTGFFLSEAQIITGLRG
jgi:hypothetical protein